MKYNRFKVNVLALLLFPLAVFLTATPSSAQYHYGYWPIQGTNYQPKDYPWGGGAMWTLCEPSVYDADCARMQAMGMNTVRIFLPVILGFNQYWFKDDWTATNNIILKVGSFLTAANKYGIKVILCFDVGIERIDAGQLNYVYAQNFYRSIITAFKYDSRILAWDIINEPDATSTQNIYTYYWPYQRSFFTQTMFNFARTLTTQYLTIGMLVRCDFLVNIGVSPDIIQYHEYSYGTKAQIKTGLANLKALFPGKNILVGEFGSSTLSGLTTEAQQNQIYKNVLDAVNEVGGIWGTLNWTLWDHPSIGYDQHGNWGCLRGDGSYKPSAYTLLWYY